jgi:Ribonuclease G/E
VGYDILRALIREQAARPGCGWHITASAKVTAELLGEMKDDLKELEAVIGASVTLVADDDFPRERFDVVPGNASEETP